jgi:predicted RNase H-like HicB family nuclease
MNSYKENTFHAMKTKTPVIFRLSLPFTVKKKGMYYVSCCPVLDVWSQGETREKSIDNLREALQLFLLDCFERGTLDKVLKESGFSPSKTKIHVKQKIDMRHEIDVPLPFMISRPTA